MDFSKNKIIPTLTCRPQQLGKATPKSESQAMKIIESELSSLLSLKHFEPQKPNINSDLLTRATKKHLHELQNEFMNSYLPSLGLPLQDQVYHHMQVHYECHLEQPMSPPPRYVVIKDVNDPEVLSDDPSSQGDLATHGDLLHQKNLKTYLYSRCLKGKYEAKRPVDFELERCQPLVKHKKRFLKKILQDSKSNFLNQDAMATAFQNHYELYGKGDLEGGDFETSTPNNAASKFLVNFFRRCQKQANTILRQTDRAALQKSKKENRQSRKALKASKRQQRILEQEEQKRQAELLNRSTIVIEKELQQRLEHLLQQIQHDPQVILPNASRKSRSFQEEYKAHLAKGEGSCKKISTLLRPNHSLSAKLWEEFNELSCSSRFQYIMQKRMQLPVFKIQKEILSTIEKNQVVIICGNTGSGKTTQITQFVLDDFLWNRRGAECHIVCTQPRRISAISVAERVAQERAEYIGNSVGYKVRLESKPPRRHASILYCTTGIFLQKMKYDKFLTSVSHIFIDEVHERDVDTDFLLIILKDLIEIRKDLKVVLLSASINAELFSAYFGNCPIISVEGSAFPVEKVMLEDTIETIKYVPSSGLSKMMYRDKKRDKLSIVGAEAKRAFFDMIKTKYSETTIKVLESMNERDIDMELLLKLIIFICQNKPVGGILVFLPGWADIVKINNKLKGDNFFSSSQFWIVPLHSLLSNIDQRRIFNKPPAGTWKIILATNIAETSITIDDVVYVIDTGKVKLTNYDELNDHSTLDSQWICKANAVQRRGRAGRVQPGICFHLFSSAIEDQMSTFMVPEMLRSRLESLILQLKILNLGQVEAFLSKAMEPPSKKTIKNSLDLLRTLNAMDLEENLTPLGYHLAKLPLEPQIGKMILFAAMFSCLDPILTLAAFLSFKDAFVMVAGMENVVNQRRREIAGNSKSDHIMLINVYDAWEEARRNGTDRKFCQDYFLSSTTLWMIHELRKQFGQYLEQISFIDSPDVRRPHLNKNSNNLHLVNAIICAGLYPNVAKIVTYPARPNGRCQPPNVTIKSGQKVQIHRKSVNQGVDEFPSQWLVYYSKIKSDHGVFVHDTSCVNPYALLFFGGNIKCDKDTVTIDDWIVFNCQEETSSLVMKLRQNLDELLAYKASNPGVTQWRHEGKLLEPIIDLITTSNSFTLVSSYEEKQVELPLEENMDLTPEEESSSDEFEEFKIEDDITDSLSNFDRPK